MSSSFSVYPSEIVTPGSLNTGLAFELNLLREVVPASEVCTPSVTELRSRSSPEEISQSEPETRRNEVSLAPVDRGIGAWSFLVGAFIVEGVIWAFPFSFGIFLTAYMNDARYGNQKNAASILPLAGTLSSGIIYCSGPLVYPFILRYPQRRRRSMFLGIFLCWSSLFAASFARKIWMLVLLQGAIYGIGGSLLYAPCISYMSEWFVQRRGLANGVIFTGTAVGGLLLPLILPFLLRKHGPAVTLRILSIVLLTLLLAVVPFLKGRLLDVRVHGTTARDSRRRWLRDPMFWVVVLANTVQGFAYFVPIIWLPTFAAAINLTDTQASLVTSLLNGFSGVGLLGYGTLSDHFSPLVLGMSSLFLTSLCTFVLWGILSTSVGGILAFGATYGILAGGWSSLWTSFARPIAKDDPSLSTTILGILMLSRGIGNVLSTPISSSLFGPVGIDDPHTKFGFTVDGGRFQSLIFYVGSVFAGAGIITGIGWAAERRRRPSQLTVQVIAARS